MLLLDVFSQFYILAVGAFAVFSIAVAAIRASGKQILGTLGEPPEFSNFSWFSMTFGAGLGVGLMVFLQAPSRSCFRATTTT
ncbi:BCCT family transporter [Shimia abyssi]|uniref:BCCT family transporter n=1 Tax=Shimia abyssi TaxID=1662395 RepID=UPI000D0D70D2